MAHRLLSRQLPQGTTQPVSWRCCALTLVSKVAGVLICTIFQPQSRGDEARNVFADLENPILRAEYLESQHIKIRKGSSVKIDP